MKVCLCCLLFKIQEGVPCKKTVSRNARIQLYPLSTPLSTPFIFMEPRAPKTVGRGGGNLGIGLSPWKGIDVFKWYNNFFNPLEISMAKWDVNMTGDWKLQNPLMWTVTIKVQCFPSICSKDGEHGGWRSLFTQLVWKGSLEKKKGFCAAQRQKHMCWLYGIYLWAGVHQELGISPTEKLEGTL